MDVMSLVAVPGQRIAHRIACRGPDRRTWHLGRLAGGSWGGLRDHDLRRLLPEPPIDPWFRYLKGRMHEFVPDAKKGW